MTESFSTACSLLDNPANRGPGVGVIFDILTRQVFSFESIQELAGQKFFEEMVCRLLPLASGLRGPA